jgi:hypothetical protein
VYNIIYPEKVDYKEILKNLDQLSIWWWVLGFVVREKEKFANPLRDDTHPGCWLDWKGEFLRLQDYGNKTYHNLSVFDAVSKKYNLTFSESLNKIITELKVETANHISTRKRKTKSGVTIISVIKRNWNDEDRKFWQPVGISNFHLETDNVIPIKAYIVNGDYYRTDGIAYDIWMTYGKWLCNTTPNDVGIFINYLNPSKEFIIAKSYRDARVIFNLGWDCCWVQGETVKTLPKNVLDIIASYGSSYILFDNDKAGDEGATVLGKTYDLPVLYFTNKEFRNYKYTHYYSKETKRSITDIVEFYTVFSEELTKQTIESAIRDAQAKEQVEKLI